jgi:putative DNA methylase
MPADRVPTLLSSLDWAELEGRVRTQQRNREVHTPAISTFRWWARRSHALIGDLLDSALGDTEDCCVGDPFSGGGTVAVEAARRGLDVFAQDLHPWAISGLTTTLRPVDPDELEQAGQLLLERLEPLRALLYRTSCPDHDDNDESEVLTAFWVRTASCPDCSRDVYLYPYSLLTKASRGAKEKDAWWGCTACGTVSRLSEERPERACAHCEAKLPDADFALMPGRRLNCPHPECSSAFSPFGQAAEWRMALVQRLCGAGARRHAHFGPPTQAELERGARAEEEVEIPAALAEWIPAGMETRVLRRCGFRQWSDLYAPRQLEVFEAAVAAIDSLRLSAAIRDRLRLALCGCAEMAGRVSRWDRYYPKAFEAMANHRFAVTGLSCETNLLAERGRGTLPRRLRQSVEAARWREEEVPAQTAISRRQAGVRAQVKRGGVVLTEGSSEAQRAASGSIDLVLTDPPYFDDVQYAELAGVFLAWARASKLVPRTAELDLTSEAVANSERGVEVERYRQLLTAIFTETNRTIAVEGRMVLTFHNSDLRAWWALGRALSAAEFTVAALATIHSENEQDHAKRGKLAFTRDLVIECYPDSARDQTPGEPVLAWSSSDPEARELLTAGRAMATMSAEEDILSFRKRFRELRGALSPMRISPQGRDVADG